jgi:hypothetical protein
MLAARASSPTPNAASWCEGVPDLFITRFAPADYVETVNTIGLPRYAKQIPMRNGKGIELEVQTNPINLCTQPGVLLKGLNS